MRVKCLLLAFSSLSIVRANDVITGINLIANEKYRHYRTPHINNVFSPLTMHSALTLLYEGASGETKVVLREILNLSWKKPTANEYGNLKFSKRNVTLKIGHKLFIRLKDSLKDRYESVLKKDFQGEVSKVDFSDKEETAREIRRWIEWKTDGTVVLPWKLQSSTRAILISVIYFKGKWGEGVNFAKNGVFTDKFYKDPNLYSNCSFMQTTGHFSLMDSRKLDAKILKLPYQNDRYSMVIMLPNSKNGLKKLHKALGCVSIEPYLKNFDKVPVKVVIPKFKYDQFHNLLTISKLMGLVEIFREDADFSDMIGAPGDFYLSEIQQRISIDVDEKGSRVASSTVDEKRQRPRLKVFEAKRPFIFIITANVDASECNQKDEVALFMGTVYTPEQ